MTLTRHNSNEDGLMTRRAQARHTAVKKLIVRHREEYEQIYGDEREARGLPRKAVNQNEYLRNQIAVLEARLAELEHSEG